LPDRALGRKKESRKRNLHFHLPAIVSCSSTLRLLQNDSSYVSFNDIYERHCRDTSISREDPILVSGEKAKKVLQEYKQTHAKTVSLLFNYLVVLLDGRSAKQDGISDPQEGGPR
jgi:transformation/transcription domain-associated protein